MNGAALRILKYVAQRGEIPLKEAIGMAVPIHGSHKDQYPLSLLLEEGYLGITINHRPPDGAEGMREYSWATFLHTFTLPEDSNGEVHYLGIITRDRMNPEKIEVFIKAKGLLYLDNKREKQRDSIFFFIAGVLAAFIGQWLEALI